MIIFSTENYSPQTNMGKFYKQLNETILNYKWWTPRRFNSGVSSKNFIIIDYSLKESIDSNDRDDYNKYQYELRWRNPDVRYLVMSDNKKFEDILDKKEHLYSANSFSNQITTAIANEICNNPATLIYNDCYTKPSENVVYTNYISPGYKQNWAMYPEYFHRSFDIKFKVY